MELYDLRQGAGLTQISLENSGIIDMLNDLIEHNKIGLTDKAKNMQRINSFIKARDGIKDYNKKILSGEQAQKEIKGVGKGISARIQEFLDTGTLKELTRDISAESLLIAELKSITGIGDVKALQLVNEYSISSVEDLVKKFQDGKIKIAHGQLTHHIAVGIRFLNDLKQRMPWQEADELAQTIRREIAKFSAEIIVEICGSYRRGAKTCGDLDIVISHPTVSPCLPDIITLLEKTILVGHLTTKGNTKYMGVCKGLSGIGRRIDIRSVNYNSLGAAILYFTGSGKFNKVMRYFANTRGYTLNEYGLYTYNNNTKGSLINAPSERDIFRILHLVYLEPFERNF